MGRLIPVLLVALTAASGAEYFVSPDGSPTAAGSLSDPWDLDSALKGASGQINPGDTLWLRGGTYRAPTSNGFDSQLTGTAEQLIIVRNFNRERATIDGRGTEFTLAVHGGYTCFWGLEIMDSNPSRQSANTWQTNAFGVAVYASGTRFVNCVVHDTAEGFSAYDTSPNSVFYGNISYYNGYIGSDRNHGHGFYMQNIEGLKIIADNIVGDNADEGFQFYGSGNSSIVGFRIFGNASYNNSSWPTPNYQYNYIIAGGADRRDIQFNNNYSFFDPQADYGFNNFGQYTDGSDITIENSVFAGGYTALSMERQAGPIKFDGNMIFARPSAVDLISLKLGEGQKILNYSWDGNQYFGTNAFWYGGIVQNFVNWKAATGFDSNSTFADAPSGSWIYLRPNQYESRRANIIIYNWDLADTVAVDLKGVLCPGDPFVVQDAQNFFGDSVASGIYSGPVSIPMKGLTKADPVGFRAPSHTAPLFGTFVVLGPQSATPATLPAFNPAQANRSPRSNRRGH